MKTPVKTLLLLLLLFVTSLAWGQTQKRERTLRVFPLALASCQAKVGYAHGLSPRWSLTAGAHFRWMHARRIDFEDGYTRTRGTLGLGLRTLPINSFGASVGIRRYTVSALEQRSSFPFRQYVELIATGTRFGEERYSECLTYWFGNEPVPHWRYLAMEEWSVGGMLLMGWRASGRVIGAEFYGGVGLHQRFRHSRYFAFDPESTEHVNDTPAIRDWYQPTSGWRSYLLPSLHLGLTLFVDFSQPLHPHP